MLLDLVFLTYQIALSEYAAVSSAWIPRNNYLHRVYTSIDGLNAIRTMLRRENGSWIFVFVQVLDFIQFISTCLVDWALHCNGDNLTHLQAVLITITSYIM
jgi:hypothetical protein